MTLSPPERDAVIKEAARLLVAELREQVDLDELITLPLDAAAQIIGLGPKQASRVLPTRQMGPRKLGVSLRSIKAYLNP